MKPLYLLLIFYALFITGFGDALELALTAVIPGIGIAIGIPLDWVINITMGSGLVLLLAQNDMFHPKLGPASLIVSALPVINTLPIWLGLVIAGIVYKRKQEKMSAKGSLAKANATPDSFSLNNPSATLQKNNTTGPAQRRLTTVTNAEAKQPASLNLKSPQMTDVTPRKPLRAANDNRPYVQKAA